ncbi:DNA polymerase III subunit delta' [Paralcaligenes sp. KSB-10]|uniref:DNA polymerase III subunit delta' n=1 Tax=Paralcaligenes sp. KSB-10 TaxID=2901142 RepID=UPI001E610F40|nr:DNA polymerase III subunit delta' [Paralcaligenes sp. KSB-10]UHL64865.1 DNA polymerase III subunit delta' [Paralcaligenes sp. KSB-10]
MSEIPRFLPWQEKVAQSWLSQRERFAHAWLLHGLAGIGKQQFALAAAASLLCEAPVQGLACGHCAACQWLASGNHPDLRRIRPDAVALEEGAEAVDEEDTGTASAKKAPSKEIRVDQLRALNHWFNTATHRGGWRVAVVYPAQALNGISANALLKVLEEPPDHTVFLLVADAPDRLLPTLVSRCRRLPLAIPSAADSQEWLLAQGLASPDSWLAAAGGAPLSALKLARSGSAACPEWLAELLGSLAQAQVPDIGRFADMLEKEPPGVWIDALQRLFLDLSLAASGVPVRYFPGLQKKIQITAERASIANLSDTGKWLVQQRAVASHPLNAKLLVHSMLQRVALACRPVS